MPSIGELIKIARGGSEESLAAIEVVGAHRRMVARSLLSSVEDEQVLAQRVAEIADLAATSFPWDPIEEDYQLSQAILAAWGPTQTPPVNVLMAAMALAPAHHFPAPLRLAAVPAWLRIHYARFILAWPPIFLHVGEADRYAATCTLAMTALAEAILDDHLPGARELADIAIRADSIMTYFNEQSLKAYFRSKAKILEWVLLDQGLRTDNNAQLTISASKKVGILNRSIAPGTESYYLLAHLEDRAARDFEVVLYVLDGAPSALSAAFGAKVDQIVPLPGDIANAVARIRQDKLDLFLITTNVAVSLSLEAAIAAHRLAKVQVIGAASPVSPGFSSSDLFLSGRLNDPSPTAQDDYEEGLVRLAGAVTYYAFSHDTDPRTVSCTRADLGASEDTVVFFSAANYYKITPELLETWSEILASTPGSRLVLMPFNPNWQQNYPVALFVRRMNRALSLFGVANSRVSTIAKVPTRADLHAVMGLADVYLDSFPFSGACSLVDPLLLGLPIVAREGRTFRSSVASSVLIMDGLEEAICPDVDAYVARAVRLARQPDVARKRRRDAGGVSVPSSTKTAPFAREFTAFCRRAMAAADEHIGSLRASSPASLREAVTNTISLVLSDPPPAFRRLTDTEIVTQLLVPYVETLAADGAAFRRIIDVGACLGLLSRPFLEAGFRADMFEPDPECQTAITSLVQRFPSLATHHAMAVTGEPVTSITFNKRSIGLSGLGESPFGDDGTLITVPATTLRQFLADHEPGVDVLKIDAEGADFEILRGVDFAQANPGTVLVEFGEHFPGQSVADIRMMLVGMRATGYEAVVFEYRKLTGFGSTNWNYELVDVSLDAHRLGERGDAFGNIIFYREDDTTFLACLVRLLEDYVPARFRPIAKRFR
jgi:FkbM family methyltransferase